MKFKEIDFCMRHKCKVCEKYLDCHLMYKEKDVLMYKPFEVLLEGFFNNNGDKT